MLPRRAARCLDVCQTLRSLDTLLPLGPNTKTQSTFTLKPDPEGSEDFCDSQEKKPGEMWEVQESLLLQREMPGRGWTLAASGRSEVDLTVDKCR